MGKMSLGATPRRVGGGRSDRHDARNASQGRSRANAPEWSDAAAAAVLTALHSCARDAGRGIVAQVKRVLSETEEAERMVKGLKLSEHDRSTARAVMQFHALKMGEQQAEGWQTKKARAFLKPLRERRATHVQPDELEVEFASEGPVSFHSWLSEKPETERLRDVRKSKRIVAGLRGWPLGWLKTTGVVCYERAAGRVKSERDGAPDAAFLQGVVKTTELPTAVAEDSDHYVVVGPGGRWLRFMSVGEVARSFGLPSESPVSRMLLETNALTENQAVACLGRAVHTSVARRLVATLMSRGLIVAGMRYGSIFSGIDTFAAGLEAEFGSEWTYAFASECDGTTRKALLTAWGAKGLAGSHCHEDGRSDGAVNEERVDLVVITGNCESHSRRNHNRNARDQHTSLKDIWAALGYVRKQSPKAVIVENVTDASSVSAITGLLGRLAGYSLERGMLDPRDVADMPVARERMFWLLVRTETDG